MCVECHADMEAKVTRRKSIVKGRVNKKEQPDHWVYDDEDVPWMTIADFTSRSGFNRSLGVTWIEQIKVHGEGHAYPGPRYAFEAPQFNEG